MKRLLSLLLITLAFPAFADNYTFDKEHTNIVFFINHMGFSETMGRIADYDGTLNLDLNAPEKSKLDITLKPASVLTQSKALDEHLQGADWFNTAKFPEIKFVSTAVTKTGEKTGEVTGNLTLLGVTKPVTLKVTLIGSGPHPMSKKQVAGFAAETTIKRSDFGMKNGIPMVGDDVRISINTETVNQDK